MIPYLDVEVFVVMKNLRYIFITSVILLSGIGIILFRDAALSCAYEGLALCGTTLIPSLFPFMVLSSFIIYSGLADVLGAKLEPLTKILFFLPGCCFCAVALSLIGGYPVGGRIIKSLYERGCINENCAERLSLFCVGAGPAFVISVVGGGIFGSSSLGVILFVSQVASALLIGIVLGLLERKKGCASKPATARNPAVSPLSDALVSSVAQASFAMISMCAFVVLFSSVIGILGASGILDWAGKCLTSLGVPYPASVCILPCVLEITNGCFISQELEASPVFFAFILSFSSLSVIFQVFSALKGIRINRLKFVVFRVVHAAISSVLTYVGIALFPQSAPTCATYGDSIVLVSSSNLFSSFVLLLMCVVFVLFLVFPPQRSTK